MEFIIPILRDMTKLVVQKSALILLLLTGGATLFAQPYTLKPIAGQGILEGAQFFEIYQDQMGFMWFSTDQGAVRFDGEEMTLFKMGKGRASHAVFNIDEDQNGRIWFHGFKDALAYYYKGSVTPVETTYANGESIQKVKNISDFKVTTSGRLLLANKNDLVQLQYDNEQLSAKNAKQGEGLRILTTRRGFFIHQFPRYDRSATEQNTIRYGNWSPLQVSLAKRFPDAYMGPSGKVLISFGEDLLVLDTLRKSVQQEKLPFQSKAVLEDFEENIWVGSLSEGLRLYQKGDFSRASHVFLPKESITDLFQDREGGIWISTLSSGIYYISSTACRAIATPLQSNRDPFITSIIGTNDAIYWGADRGYTYKLDKSTGITSDLGTEQQFSRIRGFEKSVSGKLRLFGQAPKLDSFEYEDFMAYRALAYVAYQQESFLVKPYEFLINGTSSFSQEHRIECILNAGDSLLIGTMFGLFAYSNKEYSSLQTIHEAFGGQISALKKWDDDGFLVLSRDKGLLLLRNGKAQLIASKKQPAPIDYRHLFIDSNKTIWISTSSGIHCLRNLLTKEAKTAVSYFNTFHGLPSNNIYQCYVERNEVYAATRHGLYVLDTSKKQLYSGPVPVYLKSTTLSNKDTLLEPNAQIAPMYRDITFAFQGVCQQQQNEIKYQYRLLGLDTNWLPSAEKNIRFSGIPPGSYAFEVRARKSSTPWGKGHQLASFTFLPSFHETLWFKIFLGLALLVFAFAVVAIRIRIIRTRSRLENDANRYQLQALVAQLKPHFLYNSLNAIQNYVLAHDETSCNTYLTKFSDLLRKVLHHSEDALITIEKEMSALRLYLELESMRFDNQFSFEMEVSEDIDPKECLVPPLLLQPFVENSLWHGILPKRKGQVKVMWLLEQNHLLCVVEDDGIGRKKAAELKAKKGGPAHKSHGLKLSNNRLNLVESTYKEATSIEIVDKTDADGKPNGTLVKIHLPIITNT